MQNDSFTESYLPIGLSLMHSPVGSTLLVYLVKQPLQWGGFVYNESYCTKLIICFV